MDTLKQIFSYRMLIMLLMGYSAGLPLLLIGSTLQAWLTDSQVDLTTIGFVSLIGLPYTVKFLWSPILDRYHLPFFGRRKGWMVLFQALLVLTIFCLSLVNPKDDLWLVGGIAFGIAFFSASQDIMIDAYRREILPDEELGLGNSLYVSGYRLGMIVAGAFALYLADQIQWTMVYQVMALFALPTILFTIIAPKEGSYVAPADMKEAIVGPLKEFFSRRGALIFLLFILLYKVGDQMAANMTTPFILQIGYTKTDIAYVAKTFGMIATIIGGLVGGVMLLKINLKISLVFFGILQAASTLGFAFLVHLPVSFLSLASVIAFENLAAGMGMAAYGAYMLSLTNKKFTATQYALLSSLMGITRVIIPAPTGYMADILGWEMFFIVCTLMAIPGMLLLYPVFKFERASDTVQAS